MMAGIPNSPRFCHVPQSLQVDFGIKVKFSLEQAMKAQRGNRGIAVLFL
jgi:hypothetical protein